ncbi:hypothetical protein pgond44_01948 [Psychroflexus gondwanensis ACAM 44]|jgi:uncharacterized damage-inducible protein DinB|uniref:DinB-like domain-containing protein n=1 Tax=Psychroflexus gondwanensis ACAM 44 TaxID=1189619 RepID=N1WZ14_9FLAO|nr:DinB family protein [Psychroflexus gondwanensis]EMY82422.1 hypothetical protein pgond44_01948 [Psychroflexus gondwanensis ACAM 44]
MGKAPPEYWLRGSIEGIPDLLQPAAHALLQSKLEVYKYTKSFDETLLWKMPHSRASVGFHLQHIAGVLDRMLSYAQEKNLSEVQLKELKNEGVPNAKITTHTLCRNFDAKVEEAIDYFKKLHNTDLTSKRSVGRQELPSTLIGVLFHAAEHSQRHIGQLLFTVSVLQTEDNEEKSALL